MKTSHQSYQRPDWRARLSLFAALFAFLFGALPLVLASAAALAAPAAQYDDSILSGPAPGPCAGASSGPDYIGGADAYGHTVAPADVPGLAAVHLDSDTVYPVVRKSDHDGGTEVKVNVEGLANILDAPTACSPRR